MTNVRTSHLYPINHKRMYPNNLAYDLIEMAQINATKRSRTAKQKQTDQALINQVIQLDYVPIRPILLLAKQTLSDRDKTIIDMRYLKHATLQQCGDHFNLSRERVRQIQVEIIQYFIEIGLGQTLIDLIWPLPKDIEQVVSEGYVLPLKPMFKQTLQVLIPNHDHVDINQYYQQLYDSIFHPMFPKFGIKSFNDFKDAMQKGE